MARVEGACVPTPTLVFRECVQAFRTTRVERDRGDAVAVGGSVRGAGSATLERDRRDVEARELSELSQEDTDIVIAECRRQEQAERSRLLEEAWARAESAEVEANDARSQVRSLESSLASLQAALDEAAGELEASHAISDAAEEELAALRTLAGPDHPCTLKLWPACAEAAAADHASGEHARAHRRYALACEAGQARACANWGLMFEHGLGVPADLERALSLYADACDRDDATACAQLGVATLDGGGALAEVDDVLRRACKDDVALACTTLGDALRPDPDAHDQATALLSRACTLEDAAGCLSLGDHLARDGGTPDLHAARRAYARACELGEDMACTVPHRGRMVRRNPSAPTL